MAESGDINELKQPAIFMLNKIQEHIFPRKVVHLAEPEQLIMPQEEESKQADL